MWFLKFYLEVMLVTIIPMLMWYWMFTKDSGNKPLKLLLSSVVLSLIGFPILILCGFISQGISTFMYLFCFALFLGLAPIVGIIFWGIFITVIEIVLFMIRTIFDDFKFSLVSFIFKKL